MQTIVFPLCVNGWHKLDKSWGKVENIKHLKSMFKEFFNLKQRSPFAIHNPVGVKLLSRLLLKFSHLNEHKFLRNSRDAPSSMLCVIVALKLKLRNRSLVLMLFIFCRKKKKLLNSLFEINVSLKNLNDKMLLDI